MNNIKIIDPKIIKVKNRKDGKGYLVHIIFYTDENKNPESLRIVMSTRIIYDSKKIMVPYEFAKWEPEHEELATFKEAFNNWKEMLEFTEKVVGSSGDIRDIIEKDVMAECFVEQYKHLYNYPEEEI
ncbi:hypothetical protein [Bacillus toyonensis]|uniref:hypothetical protein n=1 Tax=Bacillus toyonensis TaxID=155322 RepID=UPI0019031984|nr:hypothetical protein [Bacillus toyonensis]QQN86684.1 hypothetical protein I0K03_27775 [Bacillus toyonensis]